jgi:hypothetical protein
VPQRVLHRPKWRLVLDMLDELQGWGLRPPVLVADCGYGEVGEFRQGLEDRQLGYVVQVKADTSAYPEQTRPERLPYAGRGQPSKPRYRQPRSPVKQLILQAGPQAGVELIWRRGSKGLQRSRFVALRVRPGEVPSAGHRGCRSGAAGAVVLPAPVGADEPEHLALADREGEVVEGEQVAVAACESPKLQHPLPHSARSRPDVRFRLHDSSGEARRHQAGEEPGLLLGSYVQARRRRLTQISCSTKLVL